ncbi:hypothetical protein F4782DRAFT_548984 [Xylaria castorea]|nr:hypothetical protein F4782DRAFT_548984 [Xylaria castorea]
MKRRYDEQHILDGLGLDWNFIRRGRHLQNTGTTSALVEQNAETRVLFRERNLREKMISGNPNSQNQSALGSLEREGIVPEEQTHKPQNTGFQAPLHLDRQHTVQLGGVNVIVEANPDAKRSYDYYQSLTNTLTCGVKWNHEAFPLADQALFTKVLVEGGRSTIKLCRIGLSSGDLPLMLYDAATSKTLLKQDQWAVDNPSGFERQWWFVEMLIQEWYLDEKIHIEKSEAGDLSALAMLEVAFSCRVMSYDVPQGSFWVFWAAGMRQALQGPSPN